MSKLSSCVNTHIDPQKQKSRLPEVTGDATIDVQRQAVDRVLTELQAVQAMQKQLGTVTEQDMRVLKSLSAFMTRFADKNISVFKEMVNKNFNRNDPLQYLAPDGVLPAKVVDALSATAYKYLATRARETLYNSPDDIRKILGLKDGEQVTQNAQQLLRYAGSVGNGLYEALGNEAYTLLGMEAKDTAEGDMEARLKIALGEQIVATLEHAGYLERVVIRSGETSNKKHPLYGTSFGLKGLKDSMTAPAETFFADEIDMRNTGLKQTNFFRIADNKAAPTKLAPSEEIQEVIGSFHGSKDVWSKLFTGERDQQSYSYEPIPAPKAGKARLKKTNQDATEQQTKNLNRNENQAYKLHAPTANIFFFFNRDEQERAMGKVGAATKHITHQKGVLGTNLTINQALNNVYDWLTNTRKQPKRYKTPFYIPGEFHSQTRMGQAGPIRTQGDKNHLALFHMAGWDSTINPENTQHDRAFINAVGLALDIESGKVGGPDNSYLETVAKLDTPVISQAVEAIQSLQEEVGDLSNLDQEQLAELREDNPELAEQILAGVMAGGKNLESLQGLVEYARYLTAQEQGSTEFTTSIYTEIDGMTNGLILGQTQLITDASNKQQILTTLSNGGLSFFDSGQNTDTLLNDPRSLDAYKNTGAAFDLGVSRMMSRLTDPVALKKMGAVQALLGDFHDENGYANKIIRKISKDPTMTTVYGMGDKAQVEKLAADTVIDGAIYGKLEKIAANPNKDEAKNELRTLITNVWALTGKQTFGDSTSIYLDRAGELIPAGVLSLKLGEQETINIVEHVTEHHGEALTQAIDHVYGDLKEAYAPLNNGVNMAAALYNAAYNLHVAKRQKELGDAPLTVGDYKAIEKQLYPMFPTIKTPSGGNLPLVKFDNAGSYNEDAVVTQTYKKGSGVKEIRGFPKYRRILAPPGVRGVITAIHAMDAYIANTLMGATDISALGKHDGFIVGLDQAEATANRLNKVTDGMLSDYYMAAEFQAGVASVYEKFIAEIATLGMTKNAVKEAVTASFKDMGLDSLKIGEDKYLHKYKEVISHINKSLQVTAEETSRNKDAVMSGVVHMGQYPYEGRGADTGKTQQQTILGVDTATLIEVSRDQVQQNADEIISLERAAQKLVRATMGSAANSDNSFTMDPADYAAQVRVDQQNVVQTYDELKKQELSNPAAIHDSPEHDRRLKGLLAKLISPVMGPVDVFLKTTTLDETKGRFKTQEGETDQVFISRQVAGSQPASGILAQGLRMSTGEVYTHEMLHAIIHAALTASLSLRRQAQVLYDIARENLDFRAFLNDPTIDVLDQAHAQEVAAAQARFNYIFVTPDTTTTYKTNTATDKVQANTTSNHLDEFVALGLSNENFYNQLAGLKIDNKRRKILAKDTWMGLSGNNVQEVLVNLFNRITELIHLNFSVDKPKANVAAELERLAYSLANLDSKNKSWVWERARQLERGQEVAFSYANKYIKTAVTSWPVLRIANNIKQMGIHAKDSNTLMGKHIRKTIEAYDGLEYGLMQAIVEEVKGNTERIKPLLRILNKRGEVLDKQKQAVANNTELVVQSMFKRKLSLVEKSKFTKTFIRPDLDSLRDHANMETITDWLADPKILQGRVDEVKRRIDLDPALRPFKHYFYKASDALGFYLVNTQGTKGAEVMQNARLIATMQNTHKKDSLTAAQIAKVEPLIDQLASLHALQYTPAADRREMAALAREDMGAVEGVLQQHRMLKQEAREKLFQNNPVKFIKGYTKQILNPRIEYVTATLADKDDLEAQGYTMQTTPVPRDRAEREAQMYAGKTFTEFYMFKAGTGSVNNFQPGILSVTANKAKGISAHKIQQQLGQAADGPAVLARIMKRKQQTMKEMFSDVYEAREGTSENYMIPKVNDAGDIIDYRYVMAEHTKDTIMEQNSEIDRVLGAMAGQIVDKTVTREINVDTVGALKDLYDAEYATRSAGYVEISPYTDNPRHREIYYMIPAAARKHIETVWGGPKMYVHKNILDLAFGGHKYSIVDAFGKTKKDRHIFERLIVNVSRFAFGNQGVVRAKQLEDALVATTSLAKNNIIVRNLAVTRGNFASNLMYLKSRGLSNTYIYKNATAAITNGLQYEADKKKIDLLQSRREILAGRQIGSGLTQKEKETTLAKMDRRIRELNNNLAMNPAAEFIQSGGMPSVVDDVDTSNAQSPFPSDLEKGITGQLARLPEPVKKVGKVLFMTQDRAEYKVLNNAVKMTDYVARFVLYQHYTDSNQGSNRMTHEQAMDSVIQEFVNFATPTHQMLEYGNAIGAIWFSKYKLRVLKSIYTSIQDKPADVLATFLMSQATGVSNILNSIPGVTQDTLQAFGDPISALTGSVDEIFTIDTIDNLWK